MQKIIVLRCSEILEMEGYIKTLQNSQNKPPTSTEPEKSLNPEKISRKSSSSFLRSPSQMMKVEILFSALCLRGRSRRVSQNFPRKKVPQIKSTLKIQKNHLEYLLRICLDLNKEIILQILHMKLQCRYQRCIFVVSSVLLQFLKANSV